MSVDKVSDTKRAIGARHRLLGVRRRWLTQRQEPHFSRSTVVVRLDAEAFDVLVDAADDAEDRRELHAARAEDNYVPWDEVKSALGLE